MNPAEERLRNYNGYQGIPPLVGLETMADAATKGLSVKDSVEFLKRHHWMLRRLREIFLFRLTSMPVYELKMAFSLHLHLCSEHVMAIRTRVSEMREPPLGLDKVPHPALDRFLEEIKYAPTDEALILGIYGMCLPSILAGVETHIKKTNRLFDHPTWRVCRLLKIELEEMIEYGQQVIECLVTSDKQSAEEEWLEELEQCLILSGGIDGSGEKHDDEPPQRYSVTPFELKKIPERDERFVDPYNQGVNAEAFLFDPQYEPKPKTLMLFFKRLREIDVPEMMAALLYEQLDQPEAYQRDMCRQLWDEARHAMMGEIGFTSLDIDWRSIPFSINWSLGLNTLASPRERHAVLYFIEQGLMPAKKGKVAEWEIAIASESGVAQLIQDYDWADEVLHARIGRDWLVPQYDNQKEALEYGDQTWTRIMQEYANQMKSGLTEHRNWWPDVYRKACEFWGVKPDEKTLAYHTSYQSSRADLHEVGTEKNS